MSEGSASQPPNPSDRRAEQRIAAELEVEYDSFDEFVSSYTQNVSRGGLFIPTQKFLPIGAVVSLRLKLPEGGNTVSAIARVAYLLDGTEAALAQRKPGMGMEFLDVEGRPFADQIMDYLVHAGRPPVQSIAPPPDSLLALVVDDEPNAREIVRQVIKSRGFRVTTAKDGLEALQHALRKRPDVILTDVTMPGMDGWQLLRIVRSRPNLALIPVIFLTRLMSDSERLKGYRLGVDDYVGKPFTPDELFARVQRVIERSKGAALSGASPKSLRGDLSHVALASLLSLAEMERRTGSLLLVRDQEKTTLYLRDGAVVRIDLPEPYASKPPMEQFFHALDWKTGQFELSATEVEEEDVIKLPTSFVLLEHARRRDESSI